MKKAKFRVAGLDCEFEGLTDGSRHGQPVFETAAAKEVGMAWAAQGLAFGAEFRGDALVLMDNEGTEQEFRPNAQGRYVFGWGWEEVER